MSWDEYGGNGSGGRARLIIAGAVAVAVLVGLAAALVAFAQSQSPRLSTPSPDANATTTTMSPLDSFSPSPIEENGESADIPFRMTVQTLTELNAEYTPVASGLSIPQRDRAIEVADAYITSQLDGEGAYFATHQKVFGAATTTPNHPELIRTITYWQGKAVTGETILQAAQSVYLTIDSYTPVPLAQLPADITNADPYTTMQMVRQR